MLTVTLSQAALSVRAEPRVSLEKVPGMSLDVETWKGPMPREIWLPSTKNKAEYHSSWVSCAEETDRTWSPVELDSQSWISPEESR